MRKGGKTSLGTCPGEVMEVEWCTSFQSVVGDPWESLIASQGVREVKTVFIIILRCHLLFSLPLCHGRTVEFPGGDSMCDDAIALMTNGTCAVYFWASKISVLISHTVIDITHRNKSSLGASMILKTIKVS